MGQLPHLKADSIRKAFNNRLCSAGKEQTIINYQANLQSWMHDLYIIFTQFAPDSFIIILFFYIFFPRYITCSKILEKQINIILFKGCVIIFFSLLTHTQAQSIIIFFCIFFIVAANMLFFKIAIILNYIHLTTSQIVFLIFPRLLLIFDSFFIILLISFIHYFLLYRTPVVYSAFEIILRINLPFPLISHHFSWA